jgi:hypothetical protein
LSPGDDEIIAVSPARSSFEATALELRIVSDSERRVSGGEFKYESLESRFMSGVASEQAKRLLGRLEPRDFEHFVAAVWERRGWTTNVTKISNDRGIDIVATKHNPVERKELIQVKQYADENKVGSKQIQQYGSLRDLVDNVDTVIVVTLSEFTRPAKQTAGDLNVKLIDGEKLVRMEETVSLLDEMVEMSEPETTTETEHEETPEDDGQQRPEDDGTDLPLDPAEYTSAPKAFFDDVDSLRGESDPDVLITLIEEYVAAYLNEDDEDGSLVHTGTIWSKSRSTLSCTIVPTPDRNRCVKC